MYSLLLEKSNIAIQCLKMTTRPYCGFHRIEVKDILKCVHYPEFFLMKSSGLKIFNL